MVLLLLFEERTFEPLVKDEVYLLGGKGGDGRGADIPRVRLTLEIEIFQAKKKNTSFGESSFLA